MLKNKDIICISSIDWDFIWQGHQEIMSILAKNGNRILFIENVGIRSPGIRDISRLNKRVKNYFRGVKGIRKEMENLYILSPIIFPFPYSRLFRQINKFLLLSPLEKWMKVMSFTDPIIWTFLPTPITLDIIDNFNSKIIIYYCIDNFAVSSAQAKKIKNSEIKLFKKADLVFVTSRELYNRSRTYNDRVYTFPFAVNFHEFNTLKQKEDFIYDEIRNIKRPIIGYIGGVHRWIDFNLIKEMAQAYSHYSFVFVGPIQTNISVLLNFKNIYFLGEKAHVKIPYFINNFDVCIIPYLITDYTKNVYPTKLNEYHAMGKPVVSTDLPEIINFNIENNNLVLISKNHKEFIDNIAKAIDDSSDSLINKRISSAKRNSWDTRIEQMSSLIEEAIDRKSKMPFDWRENFIKFYKTARRRIFRLVFVSLSTYLLIFYTPLIWFLASPLKITQMPKKSDCIVVFAGGVGESGEARQGYEERVQHAVDLYKKGYADHMIFSSGYRYIFEEPLVMKALAVSLGIPEEAIILEEKAANSYENVKFVRDILDKQKWNDILLVSSPYHMLRVALVFKKNAPEIKTIFTPLSKSLFYTHGVGPKGEKILKQISLQQIKALMHEYLGIIYYWFKGYI